MTVQEVKSKLGSVYTKYREYLLAEEKCEQFRDLICGPAPVNISDEPPQEHAGNATENKYIAAMWYSEEVGRRFRKYMLARQEAEIIINSVKFPDEREVLTRRYIMFQKWEFIAEKMYFSLRQVHKLHSKGLISISETVH